MNGNVLNETVRRVAYRKTDKEPYEALVEKEWLVTNSLGG